MKISKSFTKAFIILSGCLILFTSCGNKKKNTNSQQLKEIQNYHTWYYFTDSSIKTVSSVEKIPSVKNKPWTESVRVCSSLNCNDKKADYNAYFLVNKLGIVAIKNDKFELISDKSLFSNESVDGLVNCENKPVFYVYKNTFFRTDANKKSKDLLENRPLLLEFNPYTNTFYPLVSYANLSLSNEDQIAGFSWNGTKWTVSAKNTNQDKTNFSYYSWEPFIPLTELNPALTKNYFNVTKIEESEFKLSNRVMPIDNAPELLKSLLRFVPSKISYTIKYRNEKGFSPITYENHGTTATVLSANANINSTNKCITAVFQDGTTYMYSYETGKFQALKLPKLPKNFSYNDFVLSGNTLYVSFEETDFYKTGRSGFVAVDISKL